MRKASLKSTGTPCTAIVTVLLLAGSFQIANTQTLSFQNQPTDDYVVKGDPAAHQLQLLCVVRGTPTITITWFKDNTQIGQLPFTTPQTVYQYPWTKQLPTEQDIGVYYCQATDSSGRTITSNTATVSLYERPQFIARPQNKTANLHTTVQFNCTSKGVPAVTYIWRHNDTEIQQETRPTLTVFLSNHSDAGSYECQMGNAVGSYKSKAWLTVFSQKPVVITHLEPVKSINYNDTHFFLFCNGTGIPPVTYQWRKNGVIIPNQKSTTLTPNKQDSANYTCEIKNVVGMATSSIRLIVIKTAPTAIIPYKTIRTYVGYPLTLRCIGQGIPPPTYSWDFTDYRDHSFRLVSDQKDGVFSNDIATLYDAGLYTCIVKNIAGEESTSPVFVVVDFRTPPPSFTATSVPPTTPAVIPTTATITNTGAVPIATIQTTVRVTTELVTSPSTEDNETNATDLDTSSPTVLTTQLPTTQSSPQPTTIPQPTTLVTITKIAASSSAADHTTADEGAGESSAINPGVVVGPVVGGLTLLLIGALIFFIYAQRSKPKHQPEKRPLTSTSPRSPSTMSDEVQLDMDVMVAANPALALDFTAMQESLPKETVPDSSKLDLISMGELLEKTEESIASGERVNVISRQYDSTPLKMIGMESMIPGTEHKNRYMNVLPNLETAVRLNPLSEGDIASTYINANHMPNWDNSLKSYIAAQGPTAETVDDFWRMIWEQDVSVIIMATQLVERGRAKCARYWPGEGVTEETYGNLHVVVKDITNFEDYILTEMLISLVEEGENVDKEGVEKKVSHFWFKAWPDFGIPQHTEPVLNFLHLVWAARSGPNSPLLIHCSAGIGRTGTLMAIHMGMQEFDQIGRVDPLKYLQDLRESRGGCIQTIDQYLFTHRALYTYMQQSTKSAE